MTSVCRNVSISLQFGGLGSLEDNREIFCVRITFRKKKNETGLINISIYDIAFYS